ncbi:MAG: FAD-dependent oxidoreductase [Candidatus Omnitrophica bacterium]|nr:FAD-dependent oxidoreductase [Candidatus Omnitrophota bacterium]
MKKKKVVILGAGLSGLATAYFFKKKGVDSRIFEKEKAYGGLCRSFKKDGFIFDFCGHLLHFQKPQVLSLVKELLGNKLVRHKRRALIHVLDRFIPYPFQANLQALPEDIAKECFLEFINASNNGSIKENSNFLGWINKRFGKGIARYFMIPYNEKFWKYPLNQLTYEWAERFIVTPSCEDMVDSFVGHNSKNLGYHAYFWYPEGGIGQLTESFASKLSNIYLDHEVKTIDLNRKELWFKKGGSEKFDILISTLPLPQLVKVIKDLPASMALNFGKLKWISIYNINLGLEGLVQPGRHWIYFPENKFSFYRVGFFHNFSATAAAREKSALYIEVSYSKNSPIDKKNIFAKVIEDLEKTKIISKDNRIVTKLINDISCAYPIYDHDWARMRLKILNYLRCRNIISTGRFGSWSYIPMEDVILQGQDLVNSFDEKF